MHEGAQATVDGETYAVDPEVRWVTVVPKLEDSSEHAPGEWNHYRIISRDGLLEFYVNDVLQMRATAAHPREGYIGLQSEGSPIQFRNVQLHVL